MQTVGFVLAGGLGRRMGQGRPKVLYTVEGRAMVVRAMDALRAARLDRLVAVLSHRSDEIAAALPGDVELVVQDRPRGTGSAIIAAEHLLPRGDAAVVVAFGDMPWLSAESVARLVGAIEAGASAAVLTFEFDDPPHFGRIVRDRAGSFAGIVEYKDCSSAQRRLRELNAGMFAFRPEPLRAALAQIDDDNAAGELYLTDAPGAIARAGLPVATVAASGVEETLGVNDMQHLEFARLLPRLRESERRLHLADEVCATMLGAAAHSA